jgi:hypothetical protein|tara:strand:+ start:746 stop:1267 length:522 start_codon:yes stop_codon:yes gene_type:complete
MSEEKIVSNEAVVDNGTENVDQESAQSEYIAESKKYRKRAQEAESQLAELNKKLESQENAKLKEKEEFKTLAEKFEAEVGNLSPYKDKYEALVEQRKTSLLEKLPEDKREQFINKDLDVLEFMVSELSPKTSVEPQARGTVKTNNKKVQNWTKLDSKEKAKNWADIIKSYTKK